MRGLEGKVAIVTGAAGQRGMGRAIARRLAQEGTDVVVVGRPRPQDGPHAGDSSWRGLPDVVDEVQQMGRTGLAVVADVSDHGQVTMLVQQTLEQFGRIDILVNNAAINQKPTPLVDLPDSVWDELMTVNAKGTFLCCKEVVKQMIRQQTGNIVNLASRLGKIGQANMGAYCASKFAVVALTQVLAQETARYGIRVNAVCPGWVDTDLNADLGKKEAEEWGLPLEQARERLVRNVVPLGRTASVDELANVVAFLASTESSYITGQAINFTGGRWMH